MATAQDIIAHGAVASGKMVRRFADDLTPAEYLHRPTPKSNCAAWLIGHLILADRRVLKSLGVADIPELPADFEKRFSQKDGAPEAKEFGDVTLLLPLFEKLRAAVAAAVQKLPAADLDQPLDKPHPMFSTVGPWLNFMSLHVTMHAGQITTIRRSLGRPPLV